MNKYIEKITEMEKTASQKVVREALSAFDRGAMPESSELARHIKALKEMYTGEPSMVKQRLRRTLRDADSISLAKGEVQPLIYPPKEYKKNPLRDAHYHTFNGL